MGLSSRDMDSLRLGPISQQVKARASKGQWRRIVKQAHSAGFQVEDFLNQSLPNALKARTQSSLRQQANTTISTAYAPAEAGLNSREAKIKAIDEKRSRDNKYYLDWLTARSNEMQQHTRAADNLLRDAQQQVATQANQAAAGLRDQMIKEAMAQPGVISNPQQASAFDTTAEQQRVAGQAAAQQQYTNTLIDSGEKQRQAYDSSNFAMIGAAEAKRASDTWAELAKVSDDRNSIALQKASDSAKEVSRLLGEEVSKAQSNREFGAVADRLGLQQAQLALDTKTQRSMAHDRAARRAQGDARLQLDRETADFNKAMKQADHNLKQDRLDLDWWKARHPSSGGKGGSRPSAKSPKAQDRFDYGYALVATSSRPGTPGSGNKPGKPGKRYDAKWAAKNRNLVTSQLVAKGLTRRMADAIVQAFITKSGADPGDFRQWVSSNIPRSKR